MKRLSIAKLLLCASLTWGCLIAFDNFHFYRASYFVGEPRFTKPGLASLDIIAGGGSTCQGRSFLRTNNMPA